MPRCRSAWLTALLNAHGARTYHDVYNVGIELGGDYGVCDPAVALLQPHKGVGIYGASPVIRLYADSIEDRFNALEDWCGKELDDHHRDLMAHNYEIFEKLTPNAVHVNDLDVNRGVANVLRAIGVTPDYDLIQIFQLLKIEEHFAKSQELRG